MKYLLTLIALILGMTAMAVAGAVWNPKTGWEHFEDVYESTGEMNIRDAQERERRSRGGNEYEVKDDTVNLVSLPAVLTSSRVWVSMDAFVRSGGLCQKYGHLWVRGSSKCAPNKYEETDRDNRNHCWFCHECRAYIPFKRENGTIRWDLEPQMNGFLEKRWED